VAPGAAKQLRWSVGEAQRDPYSGELLHDDLLVSAALCEVLDGLAWGLGEARSEVIKVKDPSEGLGWWGPRPLLLSKIVRCGVLGGSCRATPSKFAI
jgi:hypothetical protein